MNIRFPYKWQCLSLHIYSQQVVSTSVTFSMEFNDLPTELQFQIFEFLYPSKLQQLIAPVCKRWHAIASEPILWSELNFTSELHTPQEIVRIMNHCSFAYCVTFYNFHDFNWTYQLTEFTTVQFLSFTSCQLTGEIITEFARIFPNVLHVRFNHRIDRDVIFNIAKFINIETLDIQVSTGINGDEILDFFSQNCENLWRFCMLLAYNITERSWNKFIEARGTQLTELVVSGLHGLTSIGFQQSIEKCTNLEFLAILDVEDITDLQLASFQKLEYVKTVWIFNTKVLFSEEFCAVFKDVTFPRIETLAIVMCKNLTGEKLSVFVECCPRLRILSIGYINNFVVDDFEQIASSCRWLKKLVLMKLNDVTEDYLVRMAGKMPCIRYIYVRDCPKIRDGKKIRLDVTRNDSFPTIIITKLLE